MSDLRAFHQAVDKYLKRKGKTNIDLASHVYLQPSVLSRRLNGTGKDKLTPENVQRIVIGLTWLGCITTQQQARDLLWLMDVRDFDPSDWEAEPLNWLKPDPPPALQFAAAQGVGSGGIPMAALRTKYLEKLSQQYRFATLPITPGGFYPLQVIFQPLKLRQHPIAAEDLPFKERRALLDEPSRGEYDPRRALLEREQEQVPESWQRVPPIVIANDLKEALEKGKGRILVLGAPGSGKTTMLKAYVSTVAQQALAHASSMLPIFISLDHFAHSAQTLQQYLPVMLGTLGVDEDYAAALWDAIRRGRACLCLDGLDEVPPGQRETIVSWINALAPEKGNLWVISSRFADYHNGLFTQAECVEWEVQSLTPETRRSLAERLIPEVSRQMHGSSVLSNRRDAKSFLRALERHPRISTWGKSPLLFSLAAVVFVSFGTIPASRAALYRQVVDAVLETRQKNRWRRTTLREVAASLALKLFLQKRRTLSGEHLHRMLAEHGTSHKDIEELAADLIHSGLLEIVAEDTYGYWHNTYQEYFAAAELAKRLTDGARITREQTQELIARKRTDGQWVEILRLMVGILVDKNDENAARIALAWLHQLIELHTKPGGDDAGNLGLALVVQSLGERGEMPVRWQRAEWKRLEEDAAQAWVQALLDAADRKREAQQERLINVADDIGHFTPSVVERVVQQLTVSLSRQPARIRAAVMQVLGKLGVHVPMKTLVQALDDKHELVREPAVRALVELEEQVPLNALIKKAVRSKHIASRVAAIRVLGEMRQPSLLKHLVPGFNHEDWSIREATVIAIGNLGDQAPVKYLLHTLQDENSLVRQAAVAVLGKQRGQANDEHLLDVLRNDRNDSVRAEVLRVLGKHTPVKELIEEVMCPPYFVPYSFAYQEAAELLGEIEEQDIQDVLSTILGKRVHDPWPIIQAIKASQREPSTEDLLAYLHGNDQQACYFAADLLARRGEWALLEQFIASLEAGRSGFTRAMTIRLLGRLGEAGSTDLLVTALSDKDPSVRLAAVRAFEEMQERTPPEAAAAVGLLNDPDRKISTAAMNIVAQVSDHITVDVPLLESLFTAEESRYKAVAQAALRCLRKLERRVTPDQFSALMRQEDASIRLSVMNRLGQYAPIKHLVGPLQDKDDRIRSRAFEEVAKRDYKEEVPLDLLLQALKDENILICHYALNAITNRGEEELVTDYYDEEGVPFFPHLVTADSRKQIEELPRATKIWDDGSIGVFTTIIEPELPAHPSPGPDEELRPMDEAEKEAIKKQVRVDRLLEALEWPDAEVRLRVLQVLEKDVPEDRLIASLDDEDSVVRRKALQLLEGRTPTHLLGAALGDDYPFVRDVAMALLRRRREHVSEDEMRVFLESRLGVARASAIRALEDRLPKTLLIAALGDSEEDVRLAAFDALRKVYPEMLPVIQSELTALLAGTGSSRIVNAAVESFLSDLMANMDEVPLSWLEKLTSLLEPSWYWEVRVKAAQALGKLRRDLPEEAVERLKAMRNDSGSRAVQMAADDALAEILSFEPSVDEVF